MRNTDRGADNYMLKYCDRSHERTLIDVEPSRSSVNLMPVMRQVNTPEPRTPERPGRASGSGSAAMSKPTTTTAPEHDPSSYTRTPHLHVSLFSLFVLLKNI